MNPQSKITVNFYGKDVNVKHQKDITEVVSKRMIENGCLEGATVGFYFDKIVVNKRLAGVYVSRVQAVDIVVVVKHNSNESVKGNIKPGIYKDGTKMKLIELEGFLKPVITKKSIPSKDIGQKDESEAQTTVSNQSREKIQYSSTEIMAPYFQDLFLEYLPTIFQESGSEALAARDIAPIFNESKTSFCESGKVLGVRLMGILLGHLYRDGKLEMANCGKPYAIYKLTVKKEKPAKESSSKGFEITEEDNKISKELCNIDALLKKLEQIEPLSQLAERELLILRKQLSVKEDEFNRLKSEINSLRDELEKYRSLYRMLNGVFG